MALFIGLAAMFVPLQVFFLAPTYYPPHGGRLIHDFPRPGQPQQPGLAPSADGQAGSPFLWPNCLFMRQPVLVVYSLPGGNVRPRFTISPDLLLSLICGV
jgi:hypothetical protein